MYFVIVNVYKQFYLCICAAFEHPSKAYSVCHILLMGSYPCPLIYAHIFNNKKTLNLLENNERNNKDIFRKITYIVVRIIGHGVVNKRFETSQHTKLSTHTCHKSNHLMPHLTTSCCGRRSFRYSFSHIRSSPGVSAGSFAFLDLHQQRC